MEMRKTSVWVNRSLGLLFVFSSFGHLVGGDYPKSHVVQKGTKNSQVSGSTNRMATLQRVFKKYWYVAIPAIGAGTFCAYRFKNNSAVQNNKSNSVERKPKAEQRGAAQEEQQQSVNNLTAESVDDKTQEKTQPQERIDGENSVDNSTVKPVSGKRIVIFKADSEKLFLASEPVALENKGSWQQDTALVFGAIVLGAAVVEIACRNGLL